MVHGIRTQMLYMAMQTCMTTVYTTNGLLWKYFDNMKHSINKALKKIKEASRYQAFDFY
jgi:hypothetical protein